MTDEGTLWLDYPNVGGPSPQVRVKIEPAEKVRYEYRHSLWVKNGCAEYWPWVSGSAVIGAKEIHVSGLQNGTYEARLIFAELDEKSERSFSVTVQGEVADPNFSPSKRAAGAMRGVALEVPAAIVKDGTMRIKLTSKAGETSLSGLELIRKGDDAE